LDLIVVRHRLLGALVQKGQVRRLIPFWLTPLCTMPALVPQQQLFPNWWRELSSYKNNTYGYPFTGLTTFLCYRKDLLQDAGNHRDFRTRYNRELTPPKTWKEYTQLAEFFTRPVRISTEPTFRGKRGWLSGMSG
jgi:ABC-type glycerol-3-phosphate transport system substrate-binding protein